MSLASDAVRTLREIELDVSKDSGPDDIAWRTRLAVQIYCALKANQSQAYSQQQQQNWPGIA